MSFETGTATDRQDLLVKFFNFLQANGWTADVDYAASGQSPAYGVIHRQNQLSPENQNTVNLYCGFSPSGSPAAGDQISMIPMRGYVSGAPQNAIEVATSTADYDSDSGAVHIQTTFPSSPFENYWFFESDYYAHAVVEYAAGKFRHFGMGALNKIGKWFGGDYYYGGYWQQTTTLIDSVLNNGHTMGFDGVNNDNSRGAHMYGKQMDGSAFPDVQGRQSPETAWHVCVAGPETGAGEGTDGSGRQKGSLFANGPRGGFHHPLYYLGQIPFNGYRPMFPIHVFQAYGGSNPDNWRVLGTQPDVRTMAMKGDLLPADEFTIGSDTWIVFPVASRDPGPYSTGDNFERSNLFGIAYKKVTT